MSFAYTTANNIPTSAMPRLPLTLTNGEYSLDVIGLLDTG
jgi:hypothetical protein